jgi:hypothetical protein
MPTTRQSTRRQSAPRKTKKERMERKAKEERFRRRRINGLGKFVDLVEICGAKFYGVVERKDRIWELNSERHDGPWPLSRRELVSDFQLARLTYLPTRRLWTERRQTCGTPELPRLSSARTTEGQFPFRGFRLPCWSPVSRRNNAIAAQEPSGQTICCGRPKGPA